MSDADRDERRKRLIDRLVIDSQLAQPNGCCLGPEWRNRLCQYHLGYEDGAEAALLAIEAAEDQDQ
jgi:hypothetical protein